jgi:hypothetical protein
MVKEWMLLYIKQGEIYNSLLPQILKWVTCFRVRVTQDFLWLTAVCQHGRRLSVRLCTRTSWRRHNGSKQRADSYCAA